VLAALLAQRGFTGPKTVLHGEHGFLKLVSKEYEIEILLKGLGQDYMISKCWMKSFPSEFFTLPAITATLEIVNKSNVKPEDIKSVTVRTFSRAVSVTADPEKYRPASKETADHSLPYCVAVAIYDGTVGMRQFSKEKLKDKNLMSLIQKVHVVSDEALDKLYPVALPAIVEIKTKQAKFVQRVDFPKGSPKNPMTDKEVEEKFRTLVSDVMTTERIEKIIQTVYNLDESQNISDLTCLLRFDKCF